MTEATATRPRRRRLAHGYGPLIGWVVVFLLTVTLAPTIAREREVAATDSGASGPAAPTVATAGGADGATGQPGETRPSDGPATGTATSAGQLTATGETSPCTDRVEQVAGDPYSPPCTTWSGDNGGATSRGVSADTIVVSYRNWTDTSPSEAFSRLVGGSAVEDQQDGVRTFLGLVDYFNQNFQMYGRHLEPEVWTGTSSALTELLGGGAQQTNADALKVATEIEAFADVNALTPTYARAVAAQQVMSFGAGWAPQAMFDQSAPYAWSGFPTCTGLLAATAQVATALVGQPAASAGGDLAGRTRAFGLVAPDSPVFSPCADGIGETLRSAARYTYTIDVSTASNQAATLVARLHSDGVTTVVACADPLLMSFLTAKASEQGYFPEWVACPIAYLDLDVVGQIMAPDEWDHAFGTSATGAAVPRGSTLGYFAYKSVRDDEPSILVDQIYQQLYQLVLGVQLAGPTLTPQTFEQGMRLYQPHVGPYGTWAYPAGTYTPQQDFALIWWDSSATSIYDGRPGAYLSDGNRYPFSQPPNGWPSAAFQ